MQLATNFILTIDVEYKENKMNKIKQSELVILCIVLILFLFGSEKEIYAKENNDKSIIKVGVFNEPPAIFMDSDGNPKGIFIDLLEHIANEENIKIKYILGEWPTLIDMLESGEIDILPNLTYTKERDSLFLFNELPILTSWLEIYTNINSNITSIDDLNNKRVGVLGNSIVQKYLIKIIKENSTINVHSVMFAGYSDIISSLKNKKIDVFIADRFFHYSDFCKDDICATGVGFHPFCVHFAFTKKSENKYLVNLFNKHLVILRSTSGSEYYKSVNRWLGGYFGYYVPAYLEWIIGLSIIVLIIALIYAFIGKYNIYVKNNLLQLSNKTLIKATDDAMESDRLKTAFLQNVSHEIRTPMNGILGFISLLQEPDLDSETKKEFIHLVNQSGQRLLNTVNEIMEISMIESNSEKINYTTTNIESLMKYIVGFYTPQTREKGITIRLSEERHTVKTNLIRTDKIKLEGILTNLVNNAIKYSNNGNIEVGNYIEENMLIFFVKDQGIGIPADRIEVIFDRFVQADCQTTKKYEGVGLGLTIAKGHVENLKGKIWVNSEEKKGSTFFFSIPYLPIKNEVTDEKAEYPFMNNETILLAEDDETNFLYYKYILQKEGLKVIHVIDGLSAIKTIQKNSSISLILMDINMPGMDGLEATKKIRLFNKTIPIIAQTAYGFARDRKRAISAGCNEYFSKPIDSDKLISLIKIHLAK
jgi:signal transduction histidine kinase/CheY-like chemotaxis protein/ABC-type amino acid transport substrate-binding protein